MSGIHRLMTKRENRNGDAHSKKVCNLAIYNIYDCGAMASELITIANLPLAGTYILKQSKD